MARIDICMSINYHYQSLSDKSYSGMFCSCVCQGSERVKVEENQINFYFAKMYEHSYHFLKGVLNNRYFDTSPILGD